MKCGREFDFITKYANVIVKMKLSIVAIYDSPQCAALVNYGPTASLNVSSFFYKLVPVDVSMANRTKNYEETLTRLVSSNLTTGHNVIPSLFNVTYKLKCFN